MYHPYGKLVVYGPYQQIHEIKLTSLTISATEFIIAPTKITTTRAILTKSSTTLQFDASTGRLWLAGVAGGGWVKDINPANTKSTY